MNPAQACGALCDCVSPHEHTLGRRALISTHTARGCAQFGLCAGSKGTFTVGKDMAQGSSMLQLPEEVQKLQHPKKKRVYSVFTMSVNSCSTRTLAG